MIALNNLLNIICTEALEHAGVPEVPEHKHGAAQNYSALKRDARGAPEKELLARTNGAAPLLYPLKLVRRSDGTLDWEE